MRRLLATGFAAAVVAAAAACGNGNGNDNGDPAEPPADDNTAEVCAEVNEFLFEQDQLLQQELQSLQEEMQEEEEGELDAEQFQDEADEVVRGALADWAEGLREPASRAEDPQLSSTLDELANAMEDASAQSGEELPAEIEEGFGTFDEICANGGG